MSDEINKSSCPVDECKWNGPISKMVSGVCPKCAKKFYKKHSTHVESSGVEPNAHPTHLPTLESVAFVADHLEPISDFDWDSVSPERRPDIEAEIKRQCALSIAKFSRRLLELGGRNRNQLFIAANCFAFAAHIHPDQDKSGEEIAHKLKIGKAAFFKRVNTCRDVLKLPHIAGARSVEARKEFKRTAKKHHAKKKLTQKSKTIGNFIGRLGDPH